MLRLFYRMSPEAPTVDVHGEIRSATMNGMLRSLVFAGLLAFAASLALSVTADAQQGTKAPAPGAGAQTRPAPSGALPALPQVSFEPVRPMPVVQQVYEFAARHPEVLSYIPCYCGCESVGHRANHDCFVKSRAANGPVRCFHPPGVSSKSK